MPTQHVSADKMAVGIKSGGKHWTKKEVDARQAAAETMSRKEPIKMRVPEWLDEDARKVWRQTLKRLEGVEMLDCSDTEMLGIYCDAVSNYRKLSKGLVTILDEEGQTIAMEDSIKAIQAWMRVIASYADKLGLTPAARARLAKKKADEVIDEFGTEFD